MPELIDLVEELLSDKILEKDSNQNYILTREHRAQLFEKLEEKPMYSKLDPPRKKEGNRPFNAGSCVKLADYMNKEKKKGNFFLACR